MECKQPNGRNIHESGRLTEFRESHSNQPMQSDSSAYDEVGAQTRIMLFCVGLVSWPFEWFRLHWNGRRFSSTLSNNRLGSLGQIDFDALGRLFLLFSCDACVRLTCQIR